MVTSYEGKISQHFQFGAPFSACLDICTLQFSLVVYLRYDKYGCSAGGAYIMLFPAI